MASHYGPAAGASRGPAPRLAAIHLPSFLRFDNNELGQLLHILRDPQAVHLFALLAAGADFRTGELLTTYARLMDLMTPPQPERGQRRKGPTMKQLRDRMADLEAVGLVTRDKGDNQAHGQLRVFIRPRDPRSASTPKEGR